MRKSISFLLALVLLLTMPFLGAAGIEADNSPGEDAPFGWSGTTDTDYDKEEAIPIPALAEPAETDSTAVSANSTASTSSSGQWPSWNLFIQWKIEAECCLYGRV